MYLSREGGYEKMMKQFKNIISFLTIICCLAGSILPVYAAQREPEVATATFINEPKNYPDLYVTKLVDSDTAPAEDVFQLVLTDENDQPIKDQEYRILDGEGREITEYKGRYSNKEELKDWKNEAKITLTTGNYGVFTLRAGQTAWFEGFGVRKYKVKEYTTYLTPVKEGDSLKVDLSHARCDAEGKYLKPLYEYEEVLFTEGGYSYKDPASGSTAVKEVLSGGSSMTFTNHYFSGDGEKAELRVSKSTSFIEDYTAPDSPDFWFSLKIKGVPCVDEAYTIVGANVGENTEGTTDKKGRFSLKGGQTAVFSQIPAYADYEVTEILEDTDPDTDAKGNLVKKEMPDGWWAIGQTSQSGTTGNTTVEARFQNTNVSFGVMKTLNTGEKPDEDFTFRLTDYMGSAMKNKTYLKYLATSPTTGEPVYELSDSEQKDNQTGKICLGGKVIATGSTDDNGIFTLKPGEAAIFIGMELDPQYHVQYQVQELGHTGYSQSQPVDAKADIYGDSEDTQMIHYVNQPINLKGKLTVTKTIRADKENTKTEDKFHFVLYQELKTYGEIKKAFGESNFVSEITAALNGETGKYIAIEEGSSPSGSTDDNAEYIYASDGKNYKIYAAVEKAAYSIPKSVDTGDQGTSQGTPSFFTGPDNKNPALQPGEFILEAEQTAVFKDLPADRRYFVRETWMTSEYTEDQTGYVPIDLGTPSTSSRPAKGQCKLLSADNGASFMFTNQYDPKKVDLQLTKIDDRGEKLAGAEFMLYLGKGEYPVLPEGTTADTFRYVTSDGVNDKDEQGAVINKGTVTISDLKSGIYWLYERRAPSGYCLLKEPIKIEIKRTDTDLIVLINDKTPDQYQGGKSDVVKEVTVTTPDRSEKEQIQLTVQNLYLYELPNSGGIGIYWYTIAGVLLMLAAVLILYRTNRQRRC